MGVFVECLHVTDSAIEAGRVEWSEMVATAGTSTNAVTHGALFITCTSDEDGYVALAPTPNSAVNPRHRLKSGIPRSFVAEDGDKVHYTAG